MGVGDGGCTRLRRIFSSIGLASQQTWADTAWSLLGEREPFACFLNWSGKSHSRCWRKNDTGSTLASGKYSTTSRQRSWQQWKHGLGMFIMIKTTSHVQKSWESVTNAWRHYRPKSLGSTHVAPKNSWQPAVEGQQNSESMAAVCQSRRRHSAAVCSEKWRSCYKRSVSTWDSIQ